MDDELERLISHPFEEEKASAALASTPTYSTIRDYGAFRKSPDVVFRPHVSVADVVHERLLAAGLPLSVKETVSPYAERLESYLEEIKKSYKIYVETAVDETLEREARRLERRYFQTKATEEQLAFIRMKRYYEKIKTFQEIAKDDWREVHKLVDTLTVIAATQATAKELETDFLNSVNILIRQTDSYLDALKLYIQVEQETLDNITGSYRTVLTYKPQIRYTPGAFFGDPQELPHAEKSQESPEEEEIAPENMPGSIARSIVLETRERRLNRASILSTVLLGSRDWNRTVNYSMELPVRFYEESVEHFKEAYQVNLDPQNVQTALSTAAALVRKGQGESFLMQYRQMIHDLLADISEKLTNEDFPGLDRPNVFLYHCGPRIFLNILIATLKSLGIGEIFFLDHNNGTVREMPEELIKKELIDWWNATFSALQGEDVDSYLAYSRALEMVRKSYRALYEEGVRLRKKEQPGAAYFGLEKWMRENRVRIFGIRKIEIFRRFITGSLLEQG